MLVSGLCNALDTNESRLKRLLQSIYQCLFWSDIC